MEHDSKEIDYGNFPYEETSNGAWCVLIGGNPHYFETEEEAKLVASAPSERYKKFSDTPGEPNIDRVRKIVRLCRSPNPHIRVAIIDQLAAWLKIQGRRKSISK